MAFADTRGGRLFWRQDGASTRPALLLLHPIVTDHTVWDRMVPFLADHFRVLRVDLPGHGASAPVSKGYTVAGLADDILTVLNHAGVDRTLVCGLSFGGLVGLQMAAARPAAVTGVVAGLLNEDLASDAWADQGDCAPATTVQQFVDGFIARAFSAPDQDRLAPWLDPLRQAMLATTPEGLFGCAALQAKVSIARLVDSCPAPTTIVLNTDDDRTGLWAERADLQVTRLTGRHLPPIEAPGEFAGLVAALHDRMQPDGAGLDPARNGERVRREVLGDAWVDRSIAARDGWICDYQDYATEVAWHTIWGRKGLDYRTRRLLVLALTAALGRWEEFRFHVRLGIERGSLTVQDVKEVSLQAGLYAGVPVSNTAFNEARAIFTDLGIAFQKA